MNVSNFTSFTLVVTKATNQTNQTNNSSNLRLLANQSIQNASSQIALALSGGKEVSSANKTLQQAIGDYNLGDLTNDTSYYQKAIQEANVAYNQAYCTLNPSDAVTCAQPAGAFTNLIIFVFIIGAILLVVTLALFKGKGKVKQYDELKEKWSENVKAKLGL